MWVTVESLRIELVLSLGFWVMVTNLDYVRVIVSYGPAAVCDDHYGAVSTFHDDNICETRFSMLCTSCLELTTENCSQLL